MADNHFKVNRGLSLVPQSGAPANPSNGDIYYDSSLSKFRKYQGGSWTDLDTGGSGGTGDDLNALNFRVSISEDFSEPLATSAILDTGAGKTDATLYNALDTYMRLAYDASKTITAVGTAVTVSGAPAFTVKAGDMIQVAGNDSPKRITAVASQTSYTVESAWTTNPTAAAACISQAVHTVDLNNYAADGLAPSAAISDTFTTALVDYEDTSTVDDIILDLNVTPHIGFSISVDGSAWTVAATRPTLTSGTMQAAGASVAGSNLYIRFFANKTSGSGFVNLLGFKAYWQASTVTQNGSLIAQAYCISDGTGVEINCTVGVTASKTRIVMTNPYVVGLNPGTTNGQLDVFVNGQKLPRYIDATLTPNGSYQEIDATTIQLDSDYTAAALPIEIIKRVGVVDSSNSNTTRITALESAQASGENFLDNSLDTGFEGSTNNWTRYNDGAVAAPIDGTGGSASANLTNGVTTLTNELILGTKAMKISKLATGAALGEGIATTVTLPRGVRAGNIQFSVKYRVLSGAFTTGNLKLFVIQDYSGTPTLITPFNNDIVAGEGEVVSTFAGSTAFGAYRVCIHVADASAGSAWSIVIDDIKVKSVAAVFGAAVSDWTDFTASSNWVSNMVHSGKMRRVGDSAEIEIDMTATGATTAAQLIVNLPPGLQIDTAKLPGAIVSSQIGLGIAEGYNGGLTYHADLRYNNTTSVVGYTHVNGSTFNGDLTNTSPFTVASGSRWTIKFRVPILGWSSNVQLASTAQVKMSSILATGTRVTATPTKLGEYRTFRRTSGADAFGFEEAPTDAPSAADGMRIYGQANNTANSSGQISKWVIFIGKGKFYRFDAFNSTGRSGYVNTDYSTNFGSTDTGIKQSYDPNTGLLTIDAGSNWSGGNTSRSVGTSHTADGSGWNGSRTDCYFEVTVSENALIVGAQAVRSEIMLTAPSGAGSTNTRIRNFTVISTQIGNAITPVISSTLGSSAVINEDGVYCVTYTYDYNASASTIFVSKNSVNLSANPSAAEAIATSDFPANTAVGVSVTLNLKAGDVIRPHVGSGTFTSPSFTRFYVTKVSN